MVDSEVLEAVVVSSSSSSNQTPLDPYKFRFQNKEKNRKVNFYDILYYQISPIHLIIHTIRGSWCLS